MPALAVGAWGILVGIDLHQRRIVALMRGGGMNVQLAEPASEGKMLLRGDVLVAKEDHEIFCERAMDLVHRPVGERACQIDARYLRADDRGEFLDPDGLVRRGVIGDVPIAGSLLAGQRAHGRPPMSFSSHRNPDGAKGSTDFNSQTTK